MSIEYRYSLGCCKTVWDNGKTYDYEDWEHDVGEKSNKINIDSCAMFKNLDDCTEKTRRHVSDMICVVEKEWSKTIPEILVEKVIFVMREYNKENAAIVDSLYEILNGENK